MNDLKNEWAYRTPAIEESGPNATWEDLQGVSTGVTGDMIKFKRLKVAVYDKNSLSKDELIGEGDVSLRKLGVNIGKNVKLEIKIKDKDGLSSGTVEVTANVADSTALLEELKNADGTPLTHGYLEIKSISMSNIRNTGN
jgi:hypothetical protein